MFIYRPPWGSLGRKKALWWKCARCAFLSFLSSALITAWTWITPRLCILQHEPPLQKPRAANLLGQNSCAAFPKVILVSKQLEAQQLKGKACIRFYRISSFCLPKCKVWQVLGSGGGHPGHRIQSVKCELALLLHMGGVWVCVCVCVCATCHQHIPAHTPHLKQACMYVCVRVRDAIHTE